MHFRHADFTLKFSNIQKLYFKSCPGAPSRCIMNGKYQLGNETKVPGASAHLGKKMAIFFPVDKTGKVTVNQKVRVIQDGVKPAPRGEQGLGKIHTTVTGVVSAAEHHKAPSGFPKDILHTRQQAWSML
jgi:hypothetical protein